MFNKLPIKDIKRNLILLDRDDGHWYQTESGEIIPSVTTVKNMVTPKDWYKYYVASMMKKHNLNEKDAIEFTKHRDGESMRAGTAMHQLLEDYINDTHITIYNPDDFEKSPYKLFSSVKPILDENVTDYYGTEIKLYSEELGLAGTTDLVCEFDGVKSIVDYKNSRNYKSPRDMKSRGYYDQLCAYATMWNETYDDDIKQGINIVASWDGRCRVFKVDVDEYYTPLLNTLNKYQEITFNNT